MTSAPARPRRALLALAIGSFAIGMTEFVVMGLLPEIARELLPTAWAASQEDAIAQAGWLITLYALGVVTEVCVAFPALSALAEGFEVFVVTDASGTFNELTQQSAWARMSANGAQLMTWFGLACELHRDWRNDIEGLGTLFSNHIPDYRNLFTSYNALTEGK